MNIDTDYEPFSAMLVLSAEQYGRAISPELIKLYFDGLRHLELATVRQALTRHMRNTEVGQFWPKIADVIRQAGGGADEHAFTALAAVQDGFSAAGAYKSVWFADPITARVVEDMGGWPALCARESDEWNRFGSKDFVKRYSAYRERGAFEPAPSLVLGIIDSHNLPMGAEPTDPIVIGRDPARKAPALRSPSKQLRT